MARRRRPDQIHCGEINENLVANLLALQPGRLLLNSNGGSLSDMFAAVDYLRAHRTDIHVTGCCMSAAVPILACGRRRTATPLTRFMVHLGRMRMEADRTMDDTLLEHQELALAHQQYITILADATARDAGWWEEKVQQTYYFSAEEALEIGLIDRIV